MKFTHWKERISQESSADVVWVVPEEQLFCMVSALGRESDHRASSEGVCRSVQEFLKSQARDADATLPYVIRSYYSLAGNVLFNAILYANQKVYASNKNKTGYQKSGASLVAGYLDGNLLALAQVGGFRIVLVRDGRAREIVRPRTYGQLVDPLELTHGPENHLPLMAVGMSADCEPEIVELRLESGDRIVIETRSHGNSLVVNDVSAVTPQDLEASQILSVLEFN
jgi:serine/threonine protein phosphatase PrpC